MQYPDGFLDIALLLDPDLQVEQARDIKQDSCLFYGLLGCPKLVRNVAVLIFFV
jgi:hypothetical protein